MISIKIFAFILFCCLFQKAAGILCFKCTNELSHGDCLKRGEITRCSSQDSCQTVIHFHSYWSKKMLITKRCKQTDACMTSLVQNAENCKPFQSNTVCSCCCHQSLCNYKTYECLDDYNPPKKAKDMCKNLQNSFPESQMKCSNGYNLGSICRFLERNLDSVTELRSECIEDENGLLTWKRLVTGVGEGPAEIRESVPEDPRCGLADVGENQIVTCSDENRLGSQCTYECEDGYEIRSLLGDGGVLTCVRLSGSPDPVWDGLPPFCEKSAEPVRKCSPLVMEDDEFLDVGCSNDTTVGSVCSFQCIVGYMLTPFESSTITCGESESSPDPQWSSPVPLCKPLSCARYTVDRGTVTCSNNFFYDSTCEIECLSGHVLTPTNFTASKCLPNLMWTHSPPTCEAVLCPEFRVSNGHVRCSNGMLAGSTCVVDCDPQFADIEPIDFISSTCSMNRTWSRDPPCCAKVCPKASPVDLVVVMDSSSSIGLDYWGEIKKFVVDLISYANVGPNSTNVAVFQYSRTVNRVTEILLNQHSNGSSLGGAVSKMPYEGRGTYIGNALVHAASVSLLPSNGNRPQYPDIVLVITDGQINKYDSTFIPTQVLLQRGAKVFVVGIKSFKFGRGYDRKVLEVISGNHKERVFTGYGGFYNVTMVYDAINKEVCRRGCGIA